MTRTEEFLHLPPLSQWPQDVIIKSKNGLSEIYHFDRIWKTVDKFHLIQDTRMKGEKPLFWKCKKHLQVILKF